MTVEDNTTITRSLFVGNSAVSKGGGLYITQTAATIVNNTFYDNSAAYGGGISTYSSSASIVNTILWNNTVTQSGAQVYHSGNPDPEYSYCDVQGSLAGTGNINADPLFDNPTLLDFHLLHH